MGRSKKSLNEAVSQIKKLKAEFWSDVKIVGEKENVNAVIEKAQRVADFIELGELLAIDALNRQESCGGHFREEFQLDGEALRNDKKFRYVSAWEFNGENKKEKHHKEKLEFENVSLTQRSYK